MANEKIRVVQAFDVEMRKVLVNALFLKLPLGKNSLHVHCIFHLILNQVNEPDGRSNAV